jgi:hypothetical protein
MLILGFISLAIALGLLVVSGIATSRQIKAAGGDPSQGEFVYSWEGGVSLRTSRFMMLGWVLLVVGVALIVIALL